MKKTGFSVFAAMLLCLVLCVSALAQGSPRMIDQADLLTDAEEASLNEQLDDYSARYAVDIVVATVNSCHGESIQYYAEELFYTADFGCGDQRSGVMLIISMEERECYIYRSGIAETAISADEGDAIIDDITASLSYGDYVSAFESYLEESAYQINGELNGFPFKFGRNLIIALVIGFVVAFIATGVMRSKLKSVRFQPAATAYTKPDSMRVTVANDLFLYRTVHRTKKAKESSSSSSSRNVKVGKF